MYSGKLLNEKSKDPTYYVEFSYINEEYNLRSGTAIYFRKMPEAYVEFDEYTEYLLERYSFKEEVIRTIKLLVGKTVCDYLFRKR